MFGFGYIELFVCSDLNFVALHLVSRKYYHQPLEQVTVKILFFDICFGCLYPEKGHSEIFMEIDTSVRKNKQFLF